MGLISKKYYNKNKNNSYTTKVEEIVLETSKFPITDIKTYFLS